MNMYYFCPGGYDDYCYVCAESPEAAKAALLATKIDTSAMPDDPADLYAPHPKRDAIYQNEIVDRLCQLTPVEYPAGHVDFGCYA